jgi:hypothetical protein
LRSEGASGAAEIGVAPIVVFSEAGTGVVDRGGPARGGPAADGKGLFATRPFTIGSGDLSDTAFSGDASTFGGELLTLPVSRTGSSGSSSQPESTSSAGLLRRLVGFFSDPTPID